jgi:hypothetical protein
VKQFRAKIRPSFSRARTSGPRIDSRKTSPACKSSAEMLAVAGTTRVKSTLPDRSENAHFGWGGNFVMIETPLGFVEISTAIYSDAPWLYSFQQCAPHFVSI